MSEYQFPESDAVVEKALESHHHDSLSSRFIDGEFIDKLYAWSLEAYGPGQRTAGILDHIRKELYEIEKDPQDLEEWIDVILLALNGAQRLNVGGEAILEAFYKKCIKNVKRTWPEWKDLDPNKAIEHDRSKDSLVEKLMAETIDQPAEDARILEEAAKKIYNHMTDNDPVIHSNRFPTWEELSDEMKDEYRQRVRAAKIITPVR